MATKGKGGGGEGRLEALLDAGDHRMAGDEARRILGEPGSSAAEQKAARDVLARIRPERGALAVAAVGFALLAVVLTSLLGTP